jgi:hypothetical protein
MKQAVMTGERMKLVVVDVLRDHVRVLKVKAAQRDQTMAAFVRELIAKEVCR